MVTYCKTYHPVPLQKDLMLIEDPKLLKLSTDIEELSCAVERSDKAEPSPTKDKTETYRHPVHMERNDKLEPRLMFSHTEILAPTLTKLRKEIESPQLMLFSTEKQASAARNTPVTDTPEPNLK